MRQLFAIVLLTTLNTSEPHITEQFTTLLMKPPVVDPLQFQSPLKEFMTTSNYGERKNPFVEGVVDFHTGLDMVPTNGDRNIYAAKTGIVKTHYPSPDSYWRGHPIYGGMIVIDHGDGTETMYGHMSKTFVHEGDTVRAGQIIGVIGKTGIATGEHLHFEIHIDPMILIRKTA